MAPWPENTVLLIDDEAGWRGGQESLHTLMEGLWDRQVPFRLACAESGELARRALAAGWPASVWKPGGEFSLRNLMFLAGMMRRYRPGLVLYNTPHPAAAGLLAGAWSGVRPVQVYARRVAFPLRQNPFSHLKHRRMDAFIAISTAVQAALEHGGVESARITVIPEGLDLARFDAGPAARLDGAGSGTVFLCLAALTPEKGVDVLVRAFALHLSSGHDSHLFVAGDGVEAPRLRELGVSLGLGDRLRWLGFCRDPAALAKAADVLVMPSRSEGFGRAALFGMAASRAVIGSAVGGLTDVVVPEETGLLVPPGDASALAAALDRLAGRPGERRAMGESGRRRLEARFTVDRIVDAHRELFQNLLAKYRRS